MRDAERTIERLLAGLRAAEPPVGIERRILEALDGMGAREVAGSASLWRPAMALLLACAVILIVAIAVHPHRHAPANLSRSTIADVRPATGPKLVTQKAPPGPRRTRVLASLPHDAPAVAETRKSSFPAPPLPLTEQERLLLRLAHRGDSENIAILNPDVRAAQTAKATVQFQQFFEINATEMRSQSE